MSEAAGETIVALLFGPDQPGIVARISGWIFERGGNIIHADQHRDQEEQIFFQRVEWSHAGANLQEEGAAFEAFARSLGMAVNTAYSSRRPKFALMVSRFDHCFHDLILRWKAGDFQGDIACVVSNHESLAEEAASYGLPFYHVPVNGKAKGEAEQQQLEIFTRHEVELVVMARYMQILSGSFLERLKRPVINIHHSFLPAFAGGRPYHQAHARGVKLIGATAHYATEVLDDGPIIQQDVARVTHRHDVKDLVRKGRDLEKMVLSQAVMWHLENRILVYGRKTVVFD
jgi:formyltetrahydrofolate deformylase